MKFRLRARPCRRHAPDGALARLGTTRLRIRLSARRRLPCRPTARRWPRRGATAKFACGTPPPASCCVNSRAMQDVSCVAFSADGSKLVVCGDMSVQVWDVKSGQRIFRLPAELASLSCRRLFTRRQTAAHGWKRKEKSAVGVGRRLPATCGIHSTTNEGPLRRSPRRRIAKRWL